MAGIVRPMSADGAGTGINRRGVPLVAGLLAEATARLAEALNLERRTARLEARILLARALGVNRAWLVAHDRDPLRADLLPAIEALVSRRARGEPVAYILGEREFYGRLFQVSPAVLIPRPETELLVEAALARLPREQSARILDLGTGSGCIAISLALERPDCEVTATDASPAALAVAQANAARLGTGNLRLHSSDWYDGPHTRPYDMIVSNPPYIAWNDPHLSQGDLRYEPRQALVSGTLGLDALRTIVAQAPGHLAGGGWLLLEHGCDQAAFCARNLARTGFEAIATLHDLAGRERVTVGRWPFQA